MTAKLSGIKGGEDKSSLPPQKTSATSKGKRVRHSGRNFKQHLLETGSQGEASHTTHVDYIYSARRRSMPSGQTKENLRSRKFVQGKQTLSQSNSSMTISKLSSQVLDADGKRLRRKEKNRSLYTLGRGFMDLEIKMDILESQYHTQAALRTLYDALMEMVLHRSVNYQLVYEEPGEFRLECVKGKKLKNPDLNSRELILEKVLRPLSKKVFYFLSNSGAICSIYNLLQLVNKVYGDSDTVEWQTLAKRLGNIQEAEQSRPDRVEESATIKWTGNLKTPHSLKKLPKNEAACAEIFQKLYPIAPDKLGRYSCVLPPLLFLSSYRFFVPFNRVLTIVKSMLSLSEGKMPYHQKLRALNVIRVWLESGAEYTQEYKSKRVINNIFLLIHEARRIARESNFRELGFLADQMYLKLFLLRREKQPEIKGDQKELSGIIAPLNFIFKGFPEEGELDFLAQDIFQISGEAFLSLDAFSIFDEKRKSFPESEHFNRLVSLVYESFLKQSSYLKTNHADEVNYRKVLANLFSFYVNLSSKLADLRDFQSSAAIFCALSHSQVINLFSKGRSKNREKGFRVLFHNSLVDNKTQKKFSGLESLFDPRTSFLNLRRKCAILEKEHVPYIPHLGIIRQIVLHREEVKNHNDRLAKDEEESQYTFPNGVQLQDFLKRALPASEVRNLQSAFYSAFKKRKHFWHTDAFTVLEEMKGFNEEELETLGSYSSLEEKGDS